MLTTFVKKGGFKQLQLESLSICKENFLCLQLVIILAVAPKWLEEPQNTSMVLGRQGNVGCSASGYPQPQVHWMKKDGKFDVDCILVGCRLLSITGKALDLICDTPDNARVPVEINFHLSCA